MELTTLSNYDNISEIVQRAATLCSLSYGDYPTLWDAKGTIPQLGMEWMIGNKETFEDSEIQFLVFRGTESGNLIDWKNNLDASTDELGYHSGWSKAWLYAALDITDALESWEESKGTKKTLVCCGHSRGGALAKLAQANLHDRLESVEILVITFGAPPICKELNWRLRGQCANFVTQGDLVPYMLRPLGYSDDTSLLLKSGQPTFFWMRNPLRAHSMDNYIEALENDSYDNYLLINHDKLF